MRVLIADDSATSRILLKSALHRWGYEVVVAENGAEALEILCGPNRPSLAILDWVMPFLTGPEVCQRIRQAKLEPYTYILLLTSKNTKDETVQGLDAGADDYVVKPFDEHELRVRLHTGKRIIELQADLLKAQEALRAIAHAEQERASTDLLTMLPNRSKIRSSMEQEIARCHRKQESVGIVLLDIDHFKQINDTYGHFAGDQVLRQTAARLRGGIRQYDYVGRYGGEEFLVILPECDLRQATMQADRLRARLQAQPMVVENFELTVSASFGVTVSDGTEKSPEFFVRVADEALYQAKASGRNCVRSLTFAESALASV